MEDFTSKVWKIRWAGKVVVERLTNKKEEAMLGGADTRTDFIKPRGQSYADKGNHKARHEFYRGKIKKKHLVTQFGDFW